MSFSFYVDAPAPPSFSAVLDALREPDWACAEDAPADDRFAPGYCFHPYLRGRSARGIELCHDAGRFQVRVLTCSSRADYELALHVVRTTAHLSGGLIHPENGEGVSLDAFTASYGDAWIDEQVTTGPAVVFALVDRDGQTLTLSGARRDVHVGPRFAAELRARPGDMTAGEQLLAAMIRIQYVDEDAWYPATAFRVTPKGKGEDASFTMAVWAPDVAYLMPSVQMFALPTDDGEILVPSDAGPELAGARWTFLDERNALVEAIPQAEWDAFVARARGHAKQTFHA